MTFYDRWLRMWDESEAEKRAGRRSIHEEELDWVETVQDHRAALLIAPESGFRTMGTITMLAEIPPMACSGEHKHGEEVIYIISGSGFSVVDLVRYDWTPGSVIAVPFGSRHQHFNTGTATARYFSVLSVHLEHFAGVHRTVQFQPHGWMQDVPDFPPTPDGLDLQGRRIHISDGHASTSASSKSEPAPGRLDILDGERDRQVQKLLDGETLDVGDIEGFHRLIHLHREEDNVRQIMRVGRNVNQFSVAEQEISGVLRDPGGCYSGKHAHQEALLYVLAGSGHSVIDDELVPWKPGTAIYVPGPQTVHQHFVDSTDDSQMIRVSSGLRYFFEPILKSEWPYLLMAPRQGIVESR